MNSRLSAILGGMVGLALAVGLLLPSADQDVLVSQGLRNLLSEHLPGDEGGGYVDDWYEDFDAGQGTIFSELDRLAASTVPLTDVTLRVEVNGEVAADPAFRRAFSTRLNEFNVLREAEGLPPYDLVPEGRPAPLGVQLLVVDDTSDGGGIALTAIVQRGNRIASVGSAEAGSGPSRTTLPGRSALVPPLLAILVALMLRKTLLALFIGILAGAMLLQHADGSSWPAALGLGFVDVFAVFFWNQLVDTFRVEIIGFVILLVAMVGVMSRSGGVTGLIHLLLGFARTVRSTLLVTWGMGLLIFFDDYANCLLVGNTMRPLTDRLRISREKLAYIVDSTAAPVAGVSLLSTWIAYEVSTFSAHLPAAGIKEDGYEIFLRTLPYRYYCLFTLAFVVLTILTRRDFGPMRRAEDRARTTGKLVRDGGTPMVSDEATRIEPRPGMPELWWHAGLPILLVLFATLTSIFVEGGGWEVLQTNPGALLTLQGLDGAKGITDILFDGSGGKPIFVGAGAGFLLAVFLTGSNRARCAVLGGVASGYFLADTLGVWLASTAELLGPPLGTLILGTLDYLAYALAFLLGALVLMVVASLIGPLATTRRTCLPGADIRKASLSSVRALFFAVLILFQAWMIGEVCARMGTADYLVALLSGSVSAVMLPVVLFGAACLVAFSTGSSWSTMAILLPNVVALAASVGEADGMGALAMVVLCVGAVLEGSIFGDHCSPISDTTVLSSVSSASDHVDHVRTQAPYAITTGLLAIGLGYIPTVAFDWWSTGMALGTGIATMLALLLIVGRPAAAVPPDVDQGLGAGVSAGGAG